MIPHDKDDFPFYINSDVWLDDPFLRNQLNLSERGALMSLVAFACVCNDKVYVPDSMGEPFTTLRDKCIEHGLLIKLKRKDWYMFTCRNVLYRPDAPDKGNEDQGDQ